MEMQESKLSLQAKERENERRSDAESQSRTERANRRTIRNKKIDETRRKKRKWEARVFFGQKKKNLPRKMRRPRLLPPLLLAAGYLLLLLLLLLCPGTSALKSPISDADYLLLGSPAPLASCPAPPGQQRSASSSSSSSSSSSPPPSVNAAAVAPALWRAVPFLGSAVPSRLFAPDEDVPRGPYWRSLWERLSVNFALLLAALAALVVFAAVAASRSCSGRRLRRREDKKKRRKGGFPAAHLAVAAVPPQLTRSSYAQTFFEVEDGAERTPPPPPLPPSAVLAKTKRSLGFTVAVALAASLALVAALAACYGLSRAEAKLLHAVEGLVGDARAWLASVGEGIGAVGRPLRSAAGHLSSAADALGADEAIDASFAAHCVNGFDKDRGENRW